ncbi:hypothetical protein CAEBREN_15882 [Caenorhabditis brenneri]|uniref:C2H2-type domain-containing protein n=1 Tax=Caenorhabditis brenneri TaxID=135651 RepID=G0N759_CAEBE|nr:hypothetical protein CAEBREN_15882 [Caenorhabditis brenneri]
MTQRVESQINCEVSQMILSCNENVDDDINLQMDNNQTTFIRHKRRHIEGRKFKCEQCTLRFSGRDDLLQHYRYHYKEGKRFDCMVDSCNSVFKTFRKLSIHLDKDHIIKGSLCKLCSKEFKTERQYFYHLMGFHRDHCMVRLKFGEM